MSSPENFSYRDDSIVAKIAVDVPASTLTDLDQVRERVASIRVEQEAMARATGDWSSYLQSLPTIVEQANQAYRNMITQLERMSYIQQELGGSQSNIGMQGAPMGGQPGGGYSTAAPAGYVDPFTGLPGQGMGGMGQMTGYMQGMMMNDPRMFANMAAQRGGYINPAQLGLVGGQLAAQAGVSGGTGGGQGQGASPPASASPQATQAARDSAAPPDPANSGQPTTSEKQNIPATPHPDAPSWQQHLATAASTASSVLNEARPGRRGLMATAAGTLGAIGRIGGHGGGGGGDGGDGGGGGGDDSGGGMGKWGSIAKGAGIAGLGLGAIATVNSGIQNAGEQIQRYRNIGAEAGGGGAEGLGYEMQARMMSMNPFITLEQSRQIMQSALRNGYTGKEFDTVSEMMANNLKDMNMSANDSMQIFQTTVERGNLSLKDFQEEMANLKDLTATEGNVVGMTERGQQYSDTTSALQSMGLQGEALTNMTTSINEAFSDNRQLANVVPRATTDAMRDPTFLMFMAQANGMQDVGDPNEVLLRMQEQGIDGGQATQNTYKFIAQQALSSSGGDLTRGTVIFQRLLAGAGVNMDLASAKELFSQMVGGNANAFEKGLQKKADAQSQRRADNASIGGDDLFGVLGGGESMFSRIGGVLDPIMKARSLDDFKALPGDVWSGIKRAAGGQDEETLVNTGAPAPTGPTQIGPGSNFRAEGVKGEVSGNLTITVDQQGRVTAPQSINLTGTQKSVNAGYGSGTMNNPPPGDPGPAQGPWGR